MAVKYQPSKFAYYTEGDSLTEQEHKDSCDINLMLKNVVRGREVRGGGSTKYGYDDTTMDAVQFRIQKEQLEEQLLNGQKEFTQKQLDLIPKEIQQKFGYKLKKEAVQPKATNDEQNDESAKGTGPKKAKPKKQPDPVDQDED